MPFCALHFAVFLCGSGELIGLVVEKSYLGKSAHADGFAACYWNRRLGQRGVEVVI